MRQRLVQLAVLLGLLLVWQAVVLAGVVKPSLLLGMVIGESARATRWLAPAFYFLTAVPKSIFLPLFILALGVSVNQKVAFGVFQAVFVILVATIAAVQGVPRSLVLA